jgi:serine/threonine-protein kinase
MAEKDLDIEIFWRSTVPVEAWEQSPEITIARRSAASNASVGQLHHLIGGEFDQFELHGILGSGGMGVVHHATQHDLDRQVAYKKLHDNSAHEHAQILLQEALVTGALDHPSIVPIYALGLDADGRPAFAMKEVDGVEWKQVIKFPDAHQDFFEDLDPVEFHIRVLMRICTAVQFAHERGVLHRDIKPENVLLGRFDEVYLMDWGLAAALDSRMADRVPLASECRDVLGTPAYMAPEMARPREGTIGVLSDVYLLGATLFHALVGRPPHDAETLAMVLRNTQSKVPPQIPETVVGALAQICRRALAPDPEQRPQSADELRRELGRYLVRSSSMNLTKQASRDLMELIHWEDEQLTAGDLKETTQVRQGLADARFGFEQALQLWNENTRAQVGLKEVLSFGVRAHIRNGDLTAAESLMRQIEQPEPGLSQALSRLRSRIEDERAEHERLVRDLSEFDPRVGAQSRALASSLVPFGWAGLLLLLYFLDRHGTPLTWELWLGQAAASIALVAPVTFVGRRVFLGTKLNRRLSIGLYIALFGDLTIRIACWLTGVEPMQSVPVVMAAHGIALGMLGLQIDPRMVAGSAIYFAGVCLAGVWVEHSLLLFGSTVILALGPMALPSPGPPGSGEPPAKSPASTSPPS